MRRWVRIATAATVVPLLSLAISKPAYAAGPSITSLTPNSGAIGATVTIAGKNFGTSQGSSTVQFNGVTASSITSWSSSSISVHVPTGSSTGNVVVNVSGSASRGVLFTVNPPPVVSSLNPGFACIGRQIGISGTSFGAAPGSVAFNGVAASQGVDFSWSNNLIYADVPAGATSGNVVVFGNGVSSNGVYFSVSPNIASYSPQSGIPGTQVTIHGTSFGNSVGNSVVTFNGAAAPIVSWSDTSIVATVPNGATSGNIEVVTNGESNACYSYSGSFFAVGSLTQTLYHLHQEAGSTNNGHSVGSLLLSVSPPDAPSTVRQSANLNGNSTGSVPISMWTTANGIPGALQSSTATFSVWMNETAPVSGLYPSLNLEAYMNLAWAPPQYWSFSSLCSVQGSSSLTTTLTKYTFTCGPFTDQETFSSPFGVVVSVNWTAGHQITSNVQAQVYLEGSLNGNYDSTVTIPEIIQPFLYNLSPSQGPPGTLATLTGNAFGASQGTGAVSFNGIAAAPTSWSNTSIVVPVPTGATTGPIVVSADSQTSNALVFVVSPMITAISPATGVTGSSITINGSNFGNSRGTSTVIFNGIPGIPTSWSNAGITVLVPPGATSGPVEVVVGGVPSNAATFTCGPTLSSISPGAARPGAVVSIIGTNLGATQGSSILAFNGVPATPTSWSSTQIITAIPTSATSGPVTITISGIQSNGVYFAIGDGKISGVVSQTSNGSPIAGATVQVMQTRTNSGSTTTGSDGNYSVSNLATGTYDVIASATGLGTVISQGNAVTAGSTTTVNVSLSLPGTVSGQVTASSGGGSISGASVNVLEAGDLVASGSTDSSGNYSIGTIGSGTYNVQASASGYQPAFQSSVAVTAGNTATVNLALPSQKAITFTYDAIGRLIGAVDPQGNAVDYKYDAVGNIKSISEYPSTQTSIIGFTPASGPVGTAVTVSGSGFSATANQNSVTFNGFVATISSASATQLVVNVPNGATTGLISVTSPLGSANSSAVYTVTP